MEYKVGVCDEDYHYVINLMEYVNSTRIGGLSLVAFSSLTAVMDYVGNDYLDGVLIGEGVADGEELIPQSQGMTVMKLADEKGVPDTIYKYQSAYAIIQLIMDKLNVSEVPLPVYGNTFYGVYSPIGRCGKTSLAMGLGVNHRGSLYVSMEEFGARDSLGEEILYHIIFQNSKLHSALEKVETNQYGFKAIKGILSYMDIRQLTKENMLWLKEQLLVGGNYDRVIFDIGSSALADLNILGVMDRIYVPYLEDEAANVKLQAFKELLRCGEYADIGKKLQYLSVPECHYTSDMMREFICKGEL